MTMLPGSNLPQQQRYAWPEREEMEEGSLHKRKQLWPGIMVSVTPITMKGGEEDYYPMMKVSIPKKIS